MSRVFAGVSTDYLDMGSSPFAPPPATISAWFKAGINLPASDMYLALFGRTNSQAQQYNLRYNVADLILAVENDGTSAGAGSSISMDDTANWHHCVAVLASHSDRTAYLDGGNSTNNTTLKAPLSMQQFRVGGSCTNPPANNLNGKLAHLAIWSIALTAGEVATLYSGASPATIQPANLIDYWTLNTNASPEVPAAGSGGHTLTVNGTTYSTDDPFIATISAVVPRRIFKM